MSNHMKKNRKISDRRTKTKMTHPDAYKSRPPCDVDLLFMCIMVISRGSKKLKVNSLINIAKTDVFHNRSHKKLRKT